MWSRGAAFVAAAPQRLQQRRRGPAVQSCRARQCWHGPLRLPAAADGADQGYRRVPADGGTPAHGLLRRRGMPGAAQTSPGRRAAGSGGRWLPQACPGGACPHLRAGEMIGDSVAPARLQGCQEPRVVQQISSPLRPPRAVLASTVPSAAWRPTQQPARAAAERTMWGPGAGAPQAPALPADLAAMLSACSQLAASAQGGSAAHAAPRPQQPQPSVFQPFAAPKACAAGPGTEDALQALEWWSQVRVAA